MMKKSEGNLINSYHLKSNTWIKWLGIIFCLYCIVPVCIASQLNENPDTDKPDFSISVFSGIFIMGPGPSLRKQMINSNFNRMSPAGWFSKPLKHPRNIMQPIFSGELAFYISEKTNIAANFGIAENVEVIGYNNLTGYLNLENSIWSWSINYKRFSANGRHSYQVGPAINVYRIHASYGNTSDVDKFTKPGVYAGYSYKLLDNKWFLEFTTNYRWSPSVRVGPYAAELGYEFPETKVRLAIFNIGLSTGIKF